MITVGIDVSKKSLDACLLRESGKRKEKQFDNSPEGMAKLVRWAEYLCEGEQIHYCLEATGPYSQPVAIYLSEQSQRVSVAPPQRVAGFRQGEGITNKTDKADARLLAEFCARTKPPLYRMSQPQVRALVAMLRRLSALQTALLAEENRLEDKLLEPAVHASIQESVLFHERQIAQLEQAIKDHVDKHPDLRADKELLVSIPGVADKSAHWLMSLLADLSAFRDAQSAAAYIGLNPRICQSGTSVRKKTQISGIGGDRIRHALYMPAVCATTHNPLIRDFYKRLVGKGMPRKAAVVACMRKLVMIAYGVLKNRTKFVCSMAEDKEALDLSSAAAA